MKGIISIDSGMEILIGYKDVLKNLELKSTWDIIFVSSVGWRR